jgi:hypothetical protein
VVAGTDAAPGDGDEIPFAVEGLLGSLPSGGEPQLAARTPERSIGKTKMRVLREAMVRFYGRKEPAIW